MRLPRCADAGQVIAIGTGDALDEAEGAQACELARDGGWGELVKDGKEVSAADTGDVEGRPLEGASQTLFCGVEEIDAFDSLAADGGGWVSRSRALTPAEKSSRAERKAR